MITEEDAIRLKDQFFKRFPGLLRMRKQAYAMASDSYPVTIDEVHVLKKGKVQVFIGVKGGYFFMVKSEPTGGGPGSGAAELASMAIGFYYAVGPDA